MNRGSIEKLALICAASGITPTEWEDFLSEVRQSGSDETKRLYTRIRSDLKKLSRRFDDEVAYSGPMELTQASVHRDISKMIDKADISTTLAAKRISKELTKEFPDIDDDVIRFNSKSGLRRWLKKLINEFGDRTVLSAAGRALSERDPSSWRLG